SFLASVRSGMVRSLRSLCAWSWRSLALALQGSLLGTRPSAWRPRAAVARRRVRRLGAGLSLRGGASVPACCDSPFGLRRAWLVGHFGHFRGSREARRGCARSLHSPLVRLRG